MRKALRTVVFTAALAGLAAADAPRERFGVGVLRRDGVVIPFAAFDGRKWGARWPAPQLNLTVPVTLAAVPSRWWGPTPALDEWQVTTAAGVGKVRVVQPDWVDAHCVRQIGLRTDYRAAMPAPPRTVQPYPKDGLAISPPRAVEPIAVLAPDASEVRELLRPVQATFNQAERRTEDGYGHPIARRAREGIVPTIEAVYAYGAGPRIYYVEATRVYRELGQALGDCAAVAVGTGWFVRDAAGVRGLVNSVDLLNCRRATASYMLPLGVLRLNDRVYWLAQFSGFDHERYVVLEVKDKSVDVIINSWGGAC
jgi:hypothetical protein